MIMEEKGYGKKGKMYYYRPVEVLHLADGRNYYFDNTCSDHVMQADGNNCYQSEDDTYIAYGGITVYYRTDKPFGTQADIRIDYLDSATGQLDMDRLDVHYTGKSLKKGKKCYVKVRAYIQTDTGKVYGKYSKKKKISL